MDDRYIHRRLQCRQCKMQPIQGTRYECTQCPHFHLCAKCEDENIIQHDIRHPMLKFKVSLDEPRVSSLGTVSTSMLEAKQRLGPFDAILNANLDRHLSLGLDGLAKKQETKTAFGMGLETPDGPSGSFSFSKPSSDSMMSSPEYSQFSHLKQSSLQFPGFSQFYNTHQTKMAEQQKKTEQEYQQVLIKEHELARQQQQQQQHSGRGSGSHLQYRNGKDAKEDFHHPMSMDTTSVESMSDSDPMTSTTTTSFSSNGFTFRSPALDPYASSAPSSTFSLQHPP